MKYELVIFDLDGTVLNTLEDLADGVNQALKENGCPVRSMEEVRQFVGNGIKKLIERAVPFGSSPELVRKVFSDFNAYYGDHCADKTRVYEGIDNLIEKLRSQNVKTAIVSNKADYAVRALCEKFFDGKMDAAAGEKATVRKKPAPDSVNAVLDKLHVKKENAVYIGDSDVDIETAGNVPMDCISVAWGFRDTAFLKEHGASIIVNSPEQLFEHL